MLIRCGDIRDQSRKLSKMAKNFGRFFGRHKFFIVKIVPNLSPLPRGASTEKSRPPTSPEVIEFNRLNFMADFQFSRLNFLGGPPPNLGCALARLGQSLARVKISERSTP